MERTQIVTLAALGMILLVALFVLGRALKLTGTLVKAGCVIIFILVVILFVALWALGG
ncbi:MAG TPA: hypothetical protein G4N99_04160 [Thermoflexia bacterium]|nr:hypothetical protein [Thermoflexia bacterium]